MLRQRAAGRLRAKPVSRPVSFSVAFTFGCDLLQIESKIVKVNKRAPGKRLWTKFSTSRSSAAASTAAASRAMRRGAGNSVFLCEMNDLASGTSSWSTKLIHGGLRYLEYYEFRLVREALMEREVLWRIAPHIIRPLALRAAASEGPAPGLAAAARPVPLRPYRRPQTAAADAHGRSDARRGGQAAEARPVHPRLRIFRLLGRRRPPGRAQRARRGRSRRRDPHPHARGRDPAERDGIWQLTVEDAVSGERRRSGAARAGQCRRPLGRAGAARAPASMPRAKVRLVQGSHIVVREAL